MDNAVDVGKSELRKEFVCFIDVFGRNGALYQRIYVDRNDVSAERCANVVKALAKGGGARAIALLRGWRVRDRAAASPLSCSRVRL